jgi:tetratricopeptide (TPR) repeat protein
MSALQESIARARRKELSRLLDLLDRNMDEALRYALPLHGTPGRGVAPPGARLTARSTDFNASRIGRAGPVDAWDTGDYHAKLAAKYREAANRELALGRYRRAAYVFAQLLGDYGAAANALRQGRFFREAATLYREQLKDDRAAAECLEAGGLLLEAIPLYEKLARHEKVGDLYTTLDRPDDARRHYRRAVAEHVARADQPAAAHLLETKLGEPDEALAALESGWPHSHRAAACLRGVFELLGRLGRHQATTDRLARLRPEMTDGGLALTLADVLGRVASNYPNPDVRARAADATRVVAGSRLASGACGASEMRTLAAAVMALAPQDRLLARDANRYPSTVERPAKPPAPAHTVRRPARPAGPTLVRAFHLGAGTTVRTVFPEGDHFFAVAARGPQLLFVRGRWDGTFRTGWRHDAAAAETFYRIERPAPRGAALYAVPLRRPDAPLPPDIGPDPGFLEFFLQLPPDLGAGVLYDLCRDENDVLWSLRAPADASGLILHAHDASGRLVHSRDLGLPAVPEACDTPTALVARRGTACVLYGDELIVRASGDLRRFPLHRRPTDMRVSNPHVVPRVAITFDEGGLVVWPETGNSVRFGEGLLDPVACFTGGGELVVVGRGRGMTLRVDPDGVKNVRTFDHPGDPPLAITPAGDGNTFAMFLPDGLVRVMRLPPE